MIMMNRTQTESSNIMENMWRIIIGNINSFPYDNTIGNNASKLETFKQLVTTTWSDIIILSEHNRNLKSLEFHHQPATIICKWWTNTIVRASCLVSNSRASFEPGGTMIVTHSRSTARTCQAGGDKQNLGWNFITIKGKKEHYTTIISVYRPATHQETYMRHTAYSAKRRKLLPLDRSPDDLWFIDLGDLIADELGKGHELIIAGDFNDILNDPKSKT
jgi:hypothetical protein